MQEALNNLRTQTLALTIHADRLRQRISEVCKLLGKSTEEVNRLIGIAEVSCTFASLLLACNIKIDIFL